MYQLECNVSSRFCDLIDIYVVVPFVEEYRKLPNYASVIYDDQKYLHEYYGASSECLYLIRPDGCFIENAKGENWQVPCDDLPAMATGCYVGNDIRGLHEVQCPPRWQNRLGRTKIAKNKKEGDS